MKRKQQKSRPRLVHVVGYLMKNDPHSKVLTLFKSLLNIQHLLYMSYERRTNETIFSFHLWLFRHVIAIDNIVASTPKNTKFYGKYFHALTRHAKDFFVSFQVVLFILKKKNDHLHESNP